MSFKTPVLTVEQLESLKAAILNKPPYCSGTITLPPQGLVLYYGEGKDARKVNFSNVSDEELQHLAQACDVATFGINNLAVNDESYRKAGKLDTSDFCTNFNIYDSGLIQIVRDDLLEGNKVNDDIHPELYKINVYGPGGFFKAHKDTPRSEKMFGSLVLVFPTVHEGGALILRDKKQEWTYDSAQALAERDGPGIGYVAFYSDVEHKVTKIKSGYRVTLW